MRAPFPLLPVALLTLMATPVAAQNAPFVLFCQGQCFAVDDKGVRTPAPKGTLLREGQRLETGPDSYAQVRLGPDALCGLGESARIRFDQKSISDRDLVILDQGRIRMVGGEAIGRPEPRTIELRTSDGSFVLRSADIEVKTTLPGAGPALTIVKLNVGDARLGDLPITRESVQGFTGGKVITDRIIPLSEVAMPTPRRELPPGVTVPAPAATLPNILLPAPVVGPVRFEPVAPVLYLPPPPVLAPVTASTLVLAAPIQTTSGDLTSLNLIGTDLKTGSLTLTTTSSTSTLSGSSLSTTTGTLSGTTSCSTCALTKSDLSTAIITAPSAPTFNFTAVGR